MELRYLLLGSVLAAIVFVPLGVERLRDEPGPGWGWREMARGTVRWFRQLFSRVSWGRAGWAVALPFVWVGVYYGFVVHVRFALGRWPHFGEGMEGVLLSAHHQFCWEGLVAMFASLYPVGALFVLGLFSRRWRPISVYAVCYAAAVGLVFGASLLAPGPFLNWWFD